MNFKSCVTMLLPVATLFLFLQTWTCSANPGLSVQVSKQAIDHVSDLAGKKLNEMMSNKQIPDMSKDGKTYYKLYNIKINTFNGLNNQIALIPSNQLKWTLSVNDIQISLNWRFGKKVLWFWIRHSGSARLSFRNTYLSVNVATSKTSNGGLNLRATGCSSQTDLKISTSDIILKIVLIFFKSKIQRKIEEKICEKALETINDQVADRVSAFPVTIPFAKDYIFDYGFESNPIITSNYLRTNHKAAVYYKSGPRTIPFTPQVFPSMPENDRMIKFMISDYVFDAWLYAAYENNLLKYTLSNGNLPSDMGSILKTTCPDSVCIGSFIPEIQKKFPGQMLTLHVSSTARPQTNLIPNRIQVHIPAQLRFGVNSNIGNSEENLLTINVEVTTEMKVKIENNQIFSAITDLKLSIGDITGKVLPTLNGKTLENIINPLLGQLVQYFNEYGPNGFPITVPDKMTLTNTYLQVAKGAIILGADVNIESF